MRFPNTAVSLHLQALLVQRLRLLRRGMCVCDVCLSVEESIQGRRQPKYKLHAPTIRKVWGNITSGFDRVPKVAARPPK